MNIDKIRKTARADMEKLASTWGRLRIEEHIDYIGAELKGTGVSEGERIALNEERHVLRERLIALSTGIPA